MSANGAQRRTIPRAEPVGSLLRPQLVTQAMGEIYKDRFTALSSFVLPEKALALGDLATELDRLVNELVRRQVDSGLDVVTDGEVRRATFLSSLYESVSGWKEADARFRDEDEDGRLIYEGFADPIVDGRLQKARNPVVAEVATLRSIESPVPFKITIPAPSYFYSDIVEVAPGSYYEHDRRRFVDDIVALEREIVVEAIAAGARWIQFDFPLYPALADQRYVQILSEGLGLGADSLLTHAIEADTAVTQDIPDDVTVGLHICRGNFEGGFWSGSLEPVAERMFNELPHQRFLIEWEDTEREGDYAPIRFAPQGKVVALGLISTKTPSLEDDDQVVSRLEQAANHLPIEQLALCPQCGFASLFEDHLVGDDAVQWRKLELIGRAADRVWGRG